MRKPIKPMVINFITFAVGIILIFLYFSSATIAYEVSTVVVGVGTGLVSASVINFLFEMRTRNKIIEMVTSATMENWSSVNRIRAQQKVELTFKKVGSKIHVEVLHDFSYEGWKKFSHDDTVSIENDYRGILYPQEENFETTIPPCYFKEVRVDGEIKATWDKPDDRKDMCRITKGKLYYNMPITIPPQQGRVDLQFFIHNEYELSDKLVWTFQEISEGAKLHIKLDKSCRNMCFYFRVNHPLAKDIIHDNVQRIQTDPRTGLVKIDSINGYFHLNKKILPNQGFEIAWSEESDVL